MATVYHVWLIEKIGTKNGTKPQDGIGGRLGLLSATSSLESVQDLNFMLGI